MTVSREAEKLVADLKTVVDDGEHLLRTTSQELNTYTRERLSSTISAAKQSCERAEEICRALARRTDKTVREHPYVAVGTALGLGLAVAAILLRRR